jgi:hypothetical protein
MRSHVDRSPTAAADSRQAREAAADVLVSSRRRAGGSHGGDRSLAQEQRRRLARFDRAPQSRRGTGPGRGASTIIIITRLVMEAYRRVPGASPRTAHRAHDIIEEHNPFLTVKASEFVSSLRQRARLWPTVKLSAKQWKWLQDLLVGTGV